MGTSAGVNSRLGFHKVPETYDIDLDQVMTVQDLVALFKASNYAFIIDENRIAGLEHLIKIKEK